MERLEILQENLAVHPVREMVKVQVQFIKMEIWNLLLMENIKTIN